MRTHAVHAETDQCELLATPIESGIKVPLLLTAGIDYARHIVEEMASRPSHENDTVPKLMTETYRLVLIHMKVVPGVVVPF